MRKIIFFLFLVSSQITTVWIHLYGPVAALHLRASRKELNIKSKISLCWDPQSSDRSHVTPGSSEHQFSEWKRREYTYRVQLLLLVTTGG